jgi:hypothetical protein
VVARKLRQKLETNVRVKTVRGKNRIEIEFKDEEELERIFLTLTEGAAAVGTQQQQPPAAAAGTTPAVPAVPAVPPLATIGAGTTSSSQQVP